MPNAQWRPYASRELDAARALKPDGLLFIAYHFDAGQQRRIEQEVILCRTLGITSPLVRVYRGTVRDLEARDAAYEDSLLLARYRDAGLHPEWLPWNEMNIEDWGEDWPAQIEYAKAYLEAFRSYVSQPVIVHCPALSPTGNYRQGDAAYQAAGLYELFDRHDHHVYTERDFPTASQDACITEWNQLPARVIAHSGFDNYYFILDSDDPQFWKYSLLRNPELYDDFRDATTDIVQGGGVPEYDRNTVWFDYQKLYGPLPALQKVRAEHPELGDAIERDANGSPIEHDYGKYRVAFHAGGVAWVEIDNWGNRGAATKIEDFPLP